MTPKRLQAGDLDRKLSVFKLDTHRSVKGQIGESDSPYLMDIPCNWQEEGGTEAEETSKEVATGKVTATIRYRTDITESMSVYYQGVKYDILNVREGSGRMQWTVLKLAKHR